MKKIIASLIFLLPVIAFGQLTVRYQVCTNCPTTNSTMTVPNGGFTYSATTQQMGPQQVFSDFGRRRSNSRWHMGLDLSGSTGDTDAGDRFMPIETGTIWLLSGTGYKYIVIVGAHRFGYGHIFFDGVPGAGGMRSGDFILKKWSPRMVVTTLLSTPRYPLWRLMAR